MLPDLSDLHSEPELTRFERIWLSPGVDQQSTPELQKKIPHDQIPLPLPNQVQVKPASSGLCSPLVQFSVVPRGWKLIWPNDITALDSGTRMQLLMDSESEGKLNEQKRLGGKRGTGNRGYQTLDRNTRTGTPGPKHQDRNNRS
ncbi:unnamed protein product [Lota lota]